MSYFKAKFPNAPSKEDSATPKSLSVALAVSRQQKQRAVLPQNRDEKPSAPKPSSVAEAILAKRKAALTPPVEEGIDEEPSEMELLDMDLEEGLDPESDLEKDMDMVSAIRKRMKERQGG